MIFNEIECMSVGLMIKLRIMKNIKSNNKCDELDRNHCRLWFSVQAEKELLLSGSHVIQRGVLSAKKKKQVNVDSTTTCVFLLSNCLLYKL